MNSVSIRPRAGFAEVGEKLFQSARIDDLSMAFAGLEAMLAECDVPCEATRVLAVFDNEETGSGTKQGAHSPVLRHIMERLCIAFGEGAAGILSRIVEVVHDFGR